MSGPAETDEALLTRVAGQDAQAFADLYDRYGPASLALAARILGDRAEAETVLLAVFPRLWKEAGRYDPAKGSPAAWILSRVRHASIERLRSRGPGAEPAAGERRASTGTVAELQALELAYFEGLTQSQIAHRLGEPLGTVKTRLRLGMTRLRQVLPKLSGAPH